jgi:hypothetical protein
MIPPTIHPHVRSAAERRLFNVIRDALGTDDWICLHSLGLARHATKRRGEIDFLLLTRHGIFVLEVKGGRVAREGGVWRFTDRYGDVSEKSEGPFDQASSAMFALEQDVRNEFASDHRRSRLLFGCGVMFPDIEFDVRGTDADPRQVYDARDRRRPISTFIDRLASYWRERDARDRYAPTQKDIEAIAEFLRGDFDLIPPLGVIADEAENQLIALEKDQYAVLDSLEQFAKPRMLVQGGAGTGKTLLAVEAAKREARRGEGDVLLLCYNRLLASFLEAKLNAEHAQGSRIVVRSIFSLLNELIESSSLAAEFQAKREAADQDTIYRRLIPEYGPLALIDGDVTRFKTMIVDEAQDMMTQELLDVLDGFVEGGLETGRWWIFCDVNNQAAVFGTFDEKALVRLLTFGNVTVLSTNRRNTKPVAKETAMLTRPKVRAAAVVDGIPVKYSWYDKSGSQPAALARILSRMLKDDVRPGRITVLSPRAANACCAALVADPPLVQATRKNVWEIATGKLDAVSYCSVSSFKGLENEFIVLTDIEDLDAEWWRSVIYVGMSRARVGLHLLLAESLRSTYEACLRKWLEQHNQEIANRMTGEF